MTKDMKTKIKYMLLTIGILAVVIPSSAYAFGHTITIEKGDGERKVIWGLTQDKAKEMYLQMIVDGIDYRSLGTTADISLVDMDYADLRNKINNWCENHPEEDHLRYINDKENHTDTPRFILWCYNND